VRSHLVTVLALERTLAATADEQPVLHLERLHALDDAAIAMPKPTHMEAIP